VVVGAGLTGAMSALLMAQRGLSVTMYEKRPDLREEFKREEAEKAGQPADFWGTSLSATKRSINLALSARGQAALEKVGLLERIMAHAIPMYCRAMHSHDGKLSFQPYGKSGQHINSISRRLINTLLLDECQAKGVKMHFEHKLVAMDSHSKITMMHANGTRLTVRARIILGCDGAYSGVRSSMLRISRANFSRHYIEHGYKELTIPPTSSGEYALQPSDALHIWPRHEFMLIALPNPDKTFTATLFAPFATMDALKTNQAVKDFFQEQFPDAVPVIPELDKQFFAESAGSLVTVRMDPWNLRDKVLLMGDAAHAVVPFFGQGMNAGFEDALALDEMMEAHHDDFSAAVPAFAAARQPSGDAIATLSFENYVEMRSHTASTMFLLRKKVEGVLHAILGSNWIPRYSMVAFTRIPYDEVVRRTEFQEKVVTGVTWAGLLAVTGAVAYGAAKLLRNARL